MPLWGGGRVFFGRKGGGRLLEKYVFHSVVDVLPMHLQYWTMNNGGPNLLYKGEHLLRGWWMFVRMVSGRDIREVFNLTGRCDGGLGFIHLPV